MAILKNPQGVSRKTKKPAPCEASFRCCCGEGLESPPVICLGPSDGDHDSPVFNAPENPASRLRRILRVRFDPRLESPQFLLHQPFDRAEKAFQGGAILLDGVERDMLVFQSGFVVVAVPLPGRRARLILMVLSHEALYHRKRKAQVKKEIFFQPNQRSPRSFRCCCGAGVRGLSTRA